MKPTYAQIANDYALWGQYVDPDRTMTEVEFSQMTIDAKIDLQIGVWGAERQDDDA